MDRIMRRARIQAATSGAVVAAAATVGVMTVVHHHQDAAATSSPARVATCTPGKALDMTLKVTNNESAVRTYTLQADWYTSDGASYLSKSLTTDPVEPGHTITVKAGNPDDWEDYKAGIRCYVKVTGQQ